MNSPTTDLNARLQALEAERAEWERLARMLFDKHICAGTWGPWSDDWTMEHQKRFWEGQL